MTFEAIIALLKASGANAWELTETREAGWEFYFIRRTLDQNRLKRVRHLRVKVYRKSGDGRFLGSASGEIAPTLTEAQAKSEIARLRGNSAYVKNPFYKLNVPSDG